MSRGTVDPERSNHNRMVSADVDCVVTRRICRTELCQRSVRGLLYEAAAARPGILRAIREQLVCASTGILRVRAGLMNIPENFAALATWFKVLRKSHSSRRWGL